eukprot:gene11678-biopygen2683
MTFGPQDARKHCGAVQQLFYSDTFSCTPWGYYPAGALPDAYSQYFAQAIFGTVDAAHIIGGLYQYFVAEGDARLKVGSDPVMDYCVVWTPSTPADMCTVPSNLNGHGQDCTAGLCYPYSKAAEAARCYLSPPPVKRKRMKKSQRES